jgi:hypothetical protein
MPAAAGGAARVLKSGVSENSAGGNMKVRLGHQFARASARRVRLAGVAAALAVSTIALSLTSCTDLAGVGDRDLEILWPRNGEALIDEEVLRARVRGYDLDDYDIYWYVDDSPEEPMWDEWDDGEPYKAYRVDTWFWDWNGSGPYEIGFIAEDASGREIARRTVRVYVE